MSASVRRQFRQISAEDLHEAIQGIALATSAMLAGKTPQQVQAALGDVPGWQVESLGKGPQAGNGWVLRQYNEKGNPAGPHIRWHPGGGHHGPDSYWPVVGPQGDLGGVIR